MLGCADGAETSKHETPSLGFAFAQPGLSLLFNPSVPKKSMTTDTSWFVLEEAFHSSLFNFFDILKVAASDPEVQCEAGQYFNIAWELKNDLSHFGEYICKSPASLLSEAQKELVLRLIADLESIPAELLVADATMEGNISAMRHPAWDRVRTQAATLSQILEPLNHTNTEFFNRGS